MDVGFTQVAMEIWDVGGQAIGSPMLSSYLSGAQVSVIMSSHFVEDSQHISEIYTSDLLLFMTHC